MKQFPVEQDGHTCLHVAVDNAAVEVVAILHRYKGYFDEEKENGVRIFVSMHVTCDVGIFLQFYFHLIIHGLVRIDDNEAIFYKNFSVYVSGFVISN